MPSERAGLRGVGGKRLLSADELPWPCRRLPEPGDTLAAEAGAVKQNPFSGNRYASDAFQAAGASRSPEMDGKAGEPRTAFGHDLGESAPHYKRRKNGLGKTYEAKESNV